MSHFPFDSWWNMVGIGSVVLLIFLCILFAGDMFSHWWRKRQARKRARKGRQ